MQPENQKSIEMGDETRIELFKEDPDYRRHLLDDAEKLITALEADPNNVKLGPIYYGITSKNLKLKILTLIFPVKRPAGNNTQQHGLFAISTDDRLVGHRTLSITFTFDEGAKKALAEGAIATRYSNAGIASVIEQVHMHILQTQANKLAPDGMLTWKITNQNLMDKDYLIKQSVGLDEKTLKKLIEEKDQEQERWQNLYGPQGKIGAHFSPVDSYEFTKDFFPQIGHLNLPPSLAIKIKKKPDEVMLSDSVKYEPLNITPSSQEIEINNLKTNIANITNI